MWKHWPHFMRSVCRKLQAQGNLTAPWYAFLVLAKKYSIISTLNGLRWQWQQILTLHCAPIAFSGSPIIVTLFGIDLLVRCCNRPGTTSLASSGHMRATNFVWTTGCFRTYEKLCGDRACFSRKACCWGGEFPWLAHCITILHASLTMYNCKCSIWDNHGDGFEKSSFGIYRLVVSWKSSDVSEEYVSTIFSVVD